MMRARIVITTLVLAGCSGSDFTTVSIGLGPVPDNVRTLSVFVVDRDRSLVVASATIAEPTPSTSFELGVPAEVPLEFRAIGRTDRPGPPLVGGVMPAYFARSQRTIPLGNDIVAVDLLARPAGVLSFRPQHRDVTEDFAIELTEDGTNAPPTRLVFDSDDSIDEVAVVLPIGRYRPVASTLDGDPLLVEPQNGIFVAREQESVAVLTVFEERPVDAVARLAVTLVASDDADPKTGRVTTASVGATRFDLTIEAQSESSGSVNVQGVTIMSTVESSSPALTVRPPSAMRVDLPARIEAFEVEGHGRLRITVTAAFGDGMSARGDVLLNASRTPPGEVETIALTLAEPDRIGVGTQLWVELLDREGLFASPPTGQLSFEASDPFVYLPGGTSFELDGTGLGVVARRVSRPSGPRGVPVDIVATLTSTSVPGTWTSTLTLPVLTLAPTEE